MKISENIPLKETRVNDERKKIRRSFDSSTDLHFSRIYGVLEAKKTRSTLGNQSSMPSRDNDSTHDEVILFNNRTKMVEKKKFSGNLTYWFFLLITNE